MKEYLFETYYEYIENNVYSSDEEIARIYFTEKIGDRYSKSLFRFIMDIENEWKRHERNASD